MKMVTQDDLQSEVEHYANLPYTITVEKQDDGRGVYYVARVLELPDLLMTGNSAEEAVAELEAEKREWIEEYLKLGNKMPNPLKARHYSGKIVLRISASLHETITRMAEFEGVSLNQYMVAALARAVGCDETLAKRRQASLTKP